MPVGSVYFDMKYWVLWSLLGWHTAAAQEQAFTVRVGGLTLGQLSTQREVGKIRLESRVRVPLALFTLKVGYVVDSRFGPGHRLIRSRVDAETNRGTYFTRTELDEPRGYRMTTEQYGKTAEQQILHPIHWTVTRLFYEEPVGISEVFAEYYGTFMPIKPRGVGEYVVQWGKNRDVYVYQKGLLIKIKKENPWKNFEIRRNGFDQLN